MSSQKLHASGVVGTSYDAASGSVLVTVRGDGVIIYSQDQVRGRANGRGRAFGSLRHREESMKHLPCLDFHRIYCASA